MNFEKVETINIDHIKYLENKLLNNQFESLEKIIGNLNKKNFEHPAIQLLYANSKALKKNSNLKYLKKTRKLYLNF